jgi:tetratricopeptide (TPR) repeat protein
MVVALPGTKAAPGAAPSTAPKPVAPATVAASALENTRDPNAAIAKIREGDSLFKQARFREALFAYQDAVKLDDQSTNALLKEGLAYANMNYFKEAIAKWQHVLEIEPKNQYAPKYIATAKPHVAQEATTDMSAPQPVQAPSLIAATTAAQAATASAKTVTAEDEAAAKDLYKKAVIAINTQQSDEAVTQLNASLGRNPGYVNAYIARGGANFGLHKFSEAVADYQKALQLNPNLATPVYGLGRAYERLGDKLNACVQYRAYTGSTAVDVQQTLRKQAQDQLTALCGN